MLKGFWAADAWRLGGLLSTGAWRLCWRSGGWRALEPAEWAGAGGEVASGAGGGGWRSGVWRLEKLASGGWRSGVLASGVVARETGGRRRLEKWRLAA
jgi:hypothetical protein